MLIEDINLDVRAYLSLKRAGINTVEELINREVKDLDKARNLGVKSKKEVICKIENLGFEFIK